MENHIMKSVVASLAVSTVFLTVAAGVFASPPAPLGPSQTGQPNQSCETTPNTPGNSAAASGSAFNPNGKAGTVYAGEQPQNSVNSASVSQYDVACSKQPVDDGDFLIY
jgi:hypothetical protein